MSAITPNPQQFQQLARSPETGPVVMLNLLKFKQRADTGNGTGAESYSRYGETAVRMIEERGGHVVWQGRATQVLIGDPAADWDVVVLVEYPSRKAFIEMVSDAGYLKSHEHREQGLERTIVLACTPVTEGRA
jgi:uncharacterized protein (DUF1330 family)